MNNRMYKCFSLIPLDMQTQTCIYQATPQMQLIAKLPLQSTWPQMNLCYRMDTVKQAGHFDLLLPPTQVQKSNVESEELVDVQEHYCPLFMELLRQSFSVEKSDEIDQPGRANHSRADELYTGKGVKIADAYKFPWLQNAGKKKRCVKCSICSDRGRWLMVVFYHPHQHHQPMLAKSYKMP